MKAGTDNKTEVRVAIVLVMVAVLTVTWALMSRGAPAAQPAAAASPSAAHLRQHLLRMEEPRRQVSRSTRGCIWICWRTPKT